MANLSLYIDKAAKALVNNALSTFPATLAAFFQGDQIGVDLYFLAPTGNPNSPYNYVLYSTPGIRLGIGKISAPTGGTFYVQFGSQTSGSLVSGKRYLISTFVAGDDFTNVGAASNATGVIFTASGTTPTTYSNSSVLQEITADLAYNISAASLQTALQAMNSIGASNVLVTGDYLSGFALQFTASKGAQNVAQITAGAANLSPDSVAIIKTTRAGTSSNDEIQSLKFQQLAGAYNATWTAKSVSSSITPSTVQNGNGTTLHEVERVTFSSPPVAGSFYLSFTVGNTGLIAWNATAADIASAINAVLGANAVSVTLVPGVSFDITWASFVNQTELTVTNYDLNWAYGFSGTLSLDTLGIDQMIGAEAQITDALLEVELTPSGGTPETVLQTLVTVKNDLIENSTYGSTPNPATLLSNSASLNFGSISAGAEATLTITVTGALTTNTPSVMLGWSAALEDGIVVKQAWVSAANTVSIRVRNGSGGSIDPAAVTCRATVHNL